MLHGPCMTSWVVLRHPVTDALVAPWAAVCRSKGRHLIQTEHQLTTIRTILRPAIKLRQPKPFLQH